TSRSCGCCGSSSRCSASSRRSGTAERLLPHAGGGVLVARSGACRGPVAPRGRDRGVAAAAAVELLDDRGGVPMAQAVLVGQPVRPLQTVGQRGAPLQDVERLVEFVSGGLRDPREKPSVDLRRMAYRHGHLQGERHLSRTLQDGSGAGKGFVKLFTVCRVNELLCSEGNAGAASTGSGNTSKK